MAKLLLSQELILLQETVATTPYPHSAHRLILAHFGTFEQFATWVVVDEASNCSASFFFIAAETLVCPHCHHAPQQHHRQNLY